MKILYVASEAQPFATSGGLGDVMGSLPAAVRHKLGKSADVRVVIPMYPSVREKFSDELEMVCEMNVGLAWRNQYCGIYKTVRDGVCYYFLDNEYYFKRGGYYGNFDDGERFAFFCKAVLEMLPAVGFFPDILHANDWQSALCVIYLKRKYALIDKYLGISALYTIHNIDYQGIFDFSILGDVFELSEQDRSIVEYNGCVNLAKGAIVLADRVNTVSEHYAGEIMTEYYSAGLHHILRSCSDKLCGIVNGIDTAYYNPTTDTEIAANYSQSSLDGKAVNKSRLCKICGFEDSGAPIIAMVSRLTPQKGFDLICRVIEEMLNTIDMRFVILGTGDFEYEDYFYHLTEKYPGRFCAKIEFNKALSKQIYAGADIFLMPSKTEPCGLAQMIAARYGTIPVVRECGGLHDTIRAYNKFDKTGNGFSFANYNAHEMLETVKRALELYYSRDEWTALVKSAMKTDFSWNASAVKYIDLYEGMLL